jgi:membrane protein implicated in regulation of membrane protease activity
VNPATARRLALLASAAGVAVWFALPDSFWPHRAILVVTLALIAVTCFDRARFPGGSRTESTMGPEGDALIGSRARVVSVAPLKVEARGSVWNARAAGATPLSTQAEVAVVGRDGLTLIVRPAEGLGGPQDA